MSAKLGEYKGNPTIELSPEKVFVRKDGSKPFGFSFGLSKAKMILANLDAIRSFVEENDKTKEKERGF